MCKCLCNFIIFIWWYFTAKYIPPHILVMYPIWFLNDSQFYLWLTNYYSKLPHPSGHPVIRKFVVVNHPLDAGVLSPLLVAISGLVHIQFTTHTLQHVGWILPTCLVAWVDSTLYWYYRTTYSLQYFRFKMWTNIFRKSQKGIVLRELSHDCMLTYYPSTWADVCTVFHCMCTVLSSGQLGISYSRVLLISDARPPCVRKEERAPKMFLKVFSQGNELIKSEPRCGDTLCRHYWAAQQHSHHQNW